MFAAVHGGARGSQAPGSGPTTLNDAPIKAEANHNRIGEARAALSGLLFYCVFGDSNPSVLCCGKLSSPRQFFLSLLMSALLYHITKERSSRELIQPSPLI